MVFVASIGCVQPVRVNPHRCAAADEDPWSVESQLMRAKSQIEALEHQLSTQPHSVLRATVLGQCLTAFPQCSEPTLLLGRPRLKMRLSRDMSS